MSSAFDAARERYRRCLWQALSVWTLALLAQGGSLVGLGVVGRGLAVAGVVVGVVILVRGALGAVPGLEDDRPRLAHH